MSLLRRLVVKVLLGTPAAHFRMLIQILATPFQILLLVNNGLERRGGEGQVDDPCLVPCGSSWRPRGCF